MQPGLRDAVQQGIDLVTDKIHDFGDDVEGLSFEEELANVVKAGNDVEESTYYFLLQVQTFLGTYYCEGTCDTCDCDWADEKISYYKNLIKAASDDFFGALFQLDDAIEDTDIDLTGFVNDVDDLDDAVDFSLMRKVEDFFANCFPIFPEPNQRKC